jgi:hypothetical protein
MQRNELEKFHHTVGILVKAYLNDTLVHQDCKACAVGNIIRAHGVKLTEFVDSSQWLLFIEKNVRRNYIGSAMLDEEVANMQIWSTGYSVDELDRIENAFEKTVYHYDHDECLIDHERWNFDGLMNVVDVLADIHKVDLSIKEEAKAMFVKA